MDQSASGLSLSDFGIFAGLIFVIVGPLIGALWAALSHRMGRIELQLDGLNRTSITPDMCKAHARAVSVKVDAVDSRLQRLEARV